MGQRTSDSSLIPPEIEPTNLRLVESHSSISRCAVPTCPKNRENRGFLRFSDVWDFYDLWERHIPDIPDGRRFLQCDRKIGSISTLKVDLRLSPTSMSVNMKFACLGHRECLILSFLLPKLDTQ